MGYANDTTIYAVILRPLSRPQATELLNQSLAAIDAWCLKRPMRFNRQKIEPRKVSRFCTYAPGYGTLTLGVLSLKS